MAQRRFREQDREPKPPQTVVLGTTLRLCKLVAINENLARVAELADALDLGFYIDVRTLCEPNANPRFPREIEGFTCRNVSFSTLCEPAFR